MLDVLEVGGKFSEQRVEAKVVAKSTKREAPERKGEEDFLLRERNHLGKVRRCFEVCCEIVTKLNIIISKSANIHVITGWKD